MIVIPDYGIRRPAVYLMETTGRFFVFGLLIVGMATVSGCGSGKSLVKAPSEIMPAVCNVGRPAKKSEKVESEKTVKGYPPIPINETGPRVRRFIRQYAYKSRGSMKTYLANAARYLPMVKQIAREHQVPEDIAYLFMLESGANPNARSPANALGMWQFMPATARSYGLRVDSWVDERLDPKKSSKAAMLYLKDLYGMFGCWRLALSAYNSGENKLNSVLCKEDADEYAEICSSPRLKRETREFWPRFLAIAQIARSPEKYGFVPPKMTKYERDHEFVTINGSYTLNTLAGMSGVSKKELAELNPALIRGVTPPNGHHYSLKVPMGKRTLIAQRMMQTPTDDVGGHRIHVVNRGDSVWKILKKYKVTTSELVSLNPDLNLRKRLRRGDKIVIPVRHKKDKEQRARSGRRFTSLR